MIHDEVKTSLDVYMWDVGHGLSMTFVSPYLRSTQSGHIINRRRVIQADAGINGKYGFYPIRHLVENRGLQTIDCLVISHVDQDHIDDLVSVDELTCNSRLSVLTLLRNRTYPTNMISEDPTQESDAKAAYRDLHINYQSEAYDPNLLKAGNFGGIEVKSGHLDYRDGLDSNNSSLIVSVEFGKTQFIIPGDIEGSAVLEMQATGKLPQPLNNAYRILIAPHHGRESADPGELLKIYQPAIVLASAKEEDEFTDSCFSSSDKVYGHPVINTDGSQTRHKFMATKGEAFHVEVDPTNDYFPKIKRFSYRQPSLSEIRAAAARQLLSDYYNPLR